MIHTVPVEEAVGLILAHDITEIRPGFFKGAALRRGHVVCGRDIDHLRRLGKEHLFVLDPGPDELHEDDAAAAMAQALCGAGVSYSGPPREGKISLKAARSGLLKVDVDVLTDFNVLGEVMCATRHNNTVVSQGQTVAATRAIPLIIKKAVIERAEEIGAANGGILRILPLRRVTAGIVITGNEVYYGRIEDVFAPLIREKIAALNGSVLDTVVVPDDEEKIAGAVIALVEAGAEIVITTGGMSVDPDDRTRAALAHAGASEILYGSAVLPGAMVMVAYLREIPVVGVPACALYHKATVFDLVYPRILAGDRLNRRDLAVLGHGGLCLHCENCRFPACPFGKSP